jgi:hypothetical protein
VTVDVANAADFPAFDLADVAINLADSTQIGLPPPTANPIACEIVARTFAI